MLSLTLPMPSSSASSSASTRSTSSSLSSTFSDLSIDSSAFSIASGSGIASSPPTSSKTHAFFASSFAASPPPPRPPPSLKKSESSDSTTSSESADAHTSAYESFPTPSPSSPTKNTRFNVSRIFPSRYTSTSAKSSEQFDLQSAFSTSRLRRKPDFVILDHETDAREPDQRHDKGHSREHSFGDMFLSLPSPALDHERAHSDTSLSSASSISSSSSHVEIRLPTPPPSLPLSATSTENEFTPRPANLEPAPAIAERRLKLPTSISITPSSPSTSKGSMPPYVEPREGDIISNATVSSAPASSPSLRLLRPLGQGAFSAVWLAEDLSPVPLTLTSKQSVRDLKRLANSKGGLSRNSSLNSTTGGGVSRNSSLKRFKARLRGTRPSVGRAFLDGSDGVGSLGLGMAGKLETTWVDEEGRLLPSSSSSSMHQTLPKNPSDVGLGASLSRNNSATKRRASCASSTHTRLVAVKLTPRHPTPYSSRAEERTRVGFVREVEVLRHISHPNITPLLSYLSTPAHHVLVLPYLLGGDLLSLVNNDKAWGRLSEGVLRRMWCELCRAVGWMHNVGLVHRDIKLENVLLTWDGFPAFQDAQQGEEEEDDAAKMIDQGQEMTSPRSAPQKRKRRPRVSDLPTPLIKLSDFGLSRFIDIGNGERGQGEMLHTRCGSEAYAAPELVMGSSASSEGGAVNQRGVYDARETDAWACGVVLYALVGRKLPFGEGVGADGGHGRSSRIGGERVHVPGMGLGRRKHVSERRQWLMRIARGEYEWPEVALQHESEVGDEADDELMGPRLALSAGARRIVGRLLVRDPRKRARIAELWEDEWMREDLIGAGMWESITQEHALAHPPEASPSEEAMNVDQPETEKDGSDLLAEEDGPVGLGEGDWEPLSEDMQDGAADEELDEDGEDEGEDEDEGWLLDQEGIGNIARQEVI